MQLGLDDMTAAYRQVPVNDPSLTVIAYYAPSKGKVLFRALRGHNFGLKIFTQCVLSGRKIVFST